MRKELRPVHDLIACDLCHRTILKGERIETFIGSGDRQQVCELCSFRALRSGWMRESELERQTPDRARTGPRRSLWSRAVTWAEEQGIWGAPPTEPAEPSAAPREERVVPARAEAIERVEPVSAVSAEAAAEEPSDDATPSAPPRPVAPPDAPSPRDEAEEERPPVADRRHDRAGAPEWEDEAVWSDEPEEDVAAWARRPGRGQNGAGGLRDLLAGAGARRREPRQVHAVPTGRYAKIERAFELFNLSEHCRTIAGVGRALGEPWVSAAPVDDSPSSREVEIVVAWELSWYRFRVDLDDVDQAVALLDRGNELDDLEEGQRNWNAGTDGAGRLNLVFEAAS